MPIHLSSERRGVCSLAVTISTHLARTRHCRSGN
eukprot:COSAG02_NODE_15522_length_1163_cov_1.836466_1_plen_33_part_10